jgi:hypothetical protein
MPLQIPLAVFQFTQTLDSSIQKTMIMMDRIPLQRSDTDTNSKSIARSLRNGSVGTFLALILAILAIGGHHHHHEHAPLRSNEVDFALKDSSSSSMTLHPLLSAASSGSAVATVLVAAATGSSLDMLVVALKPVLLELGVVVILQSIGMPMVSTLGLLARRIRWASIGRGIGVSATAVKHLKVTAQVGGKIWKQTVVMYTRTSASKVVGRSKTLIKQIIKQQLHDGTNGGGDEKAIEVH